MFLCTTLKVLKDQYNDMHKTPIFPSNCSSVRQAYLTNSTSIYLHETAFYLCSVKDTTKILLVKVRNEMMFNTKVKLNIKALQTGIRYTHEGKILILL